MSTLPAAARKRCPPHTRHWGHAGQSELPAQMETGGPPSRPAHRVRRGLPSPDPPPASRTACLPLWVCPPAPLAQEPPARLALQRPPAGPRSLFSLYAGRRGMGGRVPPRALNLPNPLLLMLPLCRQGSWLGTLCVSGSHRVAFGASPASPRKRLPGGQVGPALQQPSALQTQAFLGLISWDGVS